MTRLASTALLCTMALTGPLFAQMPPGTEPAPASPAGDVEPGWLGVALETVDGQVVVSRVLPASPASRAGVTAGDVITAFNDVDVATTEFLITRVSAEPAGSLVSLTLAGPNPRRVDVLLGVRISDPAQIVQGFVGGPFPALTLSDARTGDVVTLPPEPGRVTLIDFWATWCSFCVRSIPRISTLQTTYPERLNVIAIAPESAEAILRFESRGEPVPYTLLADPEETAMTNLWIMSIPAWMLLDENNQVVGFYGARQLEALEADITARLGTSPE